MLEKLHVIFASDNGHKKVFPDIHMISLKNKESNATQ